MENLGCRGNESRILDCPVEVVEITDYNEYYANTGICSPFLNTYAFVACGTLSSAGKLNCQSSSQSLCIPCPALARANFCPHHGLRVRSSRCRPFMLHLVYKLGV